MFYAALSLDTRRLFGDGPVSVCLLDSPYGGGWVCGWAGGISHSDRDFPSVDEVGVFWWSSPPSDGRRAITAIVTYRVKLGCFAGPLRHESGGEER